MSRQYFDELVNEMLPEGIWRDLRTDSERHRAPEHDVRTTAIERVVDGNYPWNLLKVETDAGEYGLGEANPGPVSEYVDYLEPALVGENPLDVDRLVEHMTQLLSNLGGTEGYSQAAVSGIEIALWDLAGKLLDLPAYQLLGGKYRDEVRVYVDCHAGEHVGDAVARGRPARSIPRNPTSLRPTPPRRARSSTTASTRSSSTSTSPTETKTPLLVGSRIPQPTTRPLSSRPSARNRDRPALGCRPSLELHGRNGDAPRHETRTVRPRLD